jgi:hypothetical protein
MGYEGNNTPPAEFTTTIWNETPESGLLFHGIKATLRIENE